MASNEDSAAMAVDDEKYLVTSKIGRFTPSVEMTFHNEADAYAYRDIMERNKPGREYRVYRAIF